MEFAFGSPPVLGSLGWPGEPRDGMGVHEVGYAIRKALCGAATPISSGGGNVEAGSVARLVEQQA